MRFFVLMAIILVLSGSVSAECREKECMPDLYEYQFQKENTGVPDFFVDFYYDSVFEIGTNWFIIFEEREMEGYYNFKFEFENELSKSAHLEDRDAYGDVTNNSISFSGSTFSEEIFHKSLFVNITDEENKLVGYFVLEIHINKPPAEDLVFLWSGMTVFWLSIGLYVLYISSKFHELSEKIGVENNEPREKN